MIINHIVGIAYYIILLSSLCSNIIGIRDRIRITLLLVGLGVCGYDPERMTNYPVLKALLFGYNDDTFTDNLFDCGFMGMLYFAGSQMLNLLVTIPIAAYIVLTNKPWLSIATVLLLVK